MERDDQIMNDSYPVQNVHGDEEGKKIRKKIVFVTVLLSVITLAEVLMGVYIKHGTSAWPVIKWAFVVMTLVKASYIVAVFMHLGDERKNLRYIILIPYTIFICYLIFVGLSESSYINDIWQIFKP